MISFVFIIFKYIYKNLYSGGGIEGEITIFTLEQLPIPPITPYNQHITKQIEDLVNQILELTQSDGYEQDQEKQQKVRDSEEQINELVYKLYNLTEEEIKLIKEMC
ncbi:hypothetical protein [Desulfurella sp.]|uniref:hypothetical protein n=1 Tax=Desulfurella sp. TaxID=1962857 RepID=UPI0025BB1461|nr:hypothetical protein [Desulfurella sp.]